MFETLEITIYDTKKGITVIILYAVLIFYIVQCFL